MPWTRTGDNAATYPPIMAIAADPASDERTVNEVFGWVMCCAFQSAAHMTDYVIDAGTGAMLGGGRTTELVRLCVAAGVLTEIKTRAGHGAWQLIQDPEFIHIRLRAEIEWERQQSRDARDPRPIVPIRRRDGDQCRWCGIVVHWRGKRSNRTGTVDHLEPGKAGTVDTLVIACAGCNSARGNNAELWADNHTVLPAPDEPPYGKWTAQLLTNNGFPTEPTILSDSESAPVAAPPAPKSARSRVPAPAVPTGSGSGRESSTTTTPQAASTAQPTDQPTRPKPRRRGKRGGRPRTTGGQQPR